MSDLEDAINGLEALVEYLKSQRPVAPIAQINVYTPNRYLCGKCNAIINADHKFCPKCGREIDWEHVQE